MDCDALKKILIEDTDGGFMGSPGAFLAWSEYAWDGDSRRGYGDYRIPITLLTSLDGSRIPVSNVATNYGW